MEDRAMATRKRSQPKAPRSAADRTGAVAEGRVSKTNSASNVQQAIYSAISGGEVVSVGVLTLVKNTLTSALAGARDVRAQAATAGGSAGPRAIRAPQATGARLR